MAFTAQDVKTLREMTNVGMMDCKKALTETDGDMDKAVEWLREKGLAKAAKKAGRIAAEGMAYADVCPKCGRTEDAHNQPFERIRRITGYLVGTLDRFNDAKRAEEHDRVKHDVPTAE